MQLSLKAVTYPVAPGRFRLPILSLTLAIYRRWRRDAGWSNHPTYRYIGINTMSGANRLWLRFGKHVETGGRVHLYLGKINVWQDVRPASRRPQPTTKTEAARVLNMGPLIVELWRPTYAA